MTLNTDNSRSIVRSPTDRAILRVTSYRCRECGKWHKKGSKLYESHYSSSFDSNGNYIFHPASEENHNE